jgi:Ca2+-transporting ATPase
MILTDDNFGTLVHALEIVRRVFDKVVAYVRYQMTQLLALVLLFLAATVFDINDGVAMTPTMVLYLLFFATAGGVIIIAVDPGDPDVMHRPPRDPAEGVLGGGLLPRVLTLAAVVATVSLGVGVWADAAGHPWQSMIFVTLTLQQRGIALALRSQQRSMVAVGLRGNPLLLLAVAGNVVLLWLAVAWSPLAELLGTEHLTWPELGLCAAAALTAPAFVEMLKAWDRRRIRRS